MNTLTEFESSIYSAIQTKCVKYKWYALDPNRNDYDKVLSALKKIIYIFGCVEFKDDNYDSYRKCDSHVDVREYFQNQNTGDSGCAESTISQKASNTIKEEKESLKSKQIELKKKPEHKRDRPLDSVEIERQRIVDKIMAEYNKKGEAARAESLKEQERLNKIKEWKKN